MVSKIGARPNLRDLARTGAKVVLHTLGLAVAVILSAALVHVAPAWSHSGDLGTVTTGFLPALGDLFSAMERALGSLSASPAHGSMVIVLLGFLYGVLHAAGPGHGKVIIASYLLANGETVRRGIAIAFMAAALQAFMALALVGGFALITGPWSLVPTSVVLGLEGVSWIAVSLIGLAILWTNLASRRMQVVASEQCACCDQHMPAPHRLAGAWSLRRALPVACAIGVRPCTGAIVLLVYAIAQGQLLAGGLGVAAMAFGTALTVSLLATLAVSCREWSIAYWSSESTAFLFTHIKPIAAAILVLAGVAGLSSTISTLA